MKFRVLFLPFIAVILATIVLYSLLKWLLIIRFELFQGDESIFNIGIPIIISLLVVYIFIKPQLRLLRYKDSGKETAFFLLSVSALLIPLMISQSFLDSYSGRLTKVSSIYEFNKRPVTKYYELKHYFVDKWRFENAVSFDVSGKYGENFNMHLYYTIPIYENMADTVAVNCPYWLAEGFQHTVSNNLSENEKEREFQEFIKRTEKDYEWKRLDSFQYFERLRNTNDLKYYHEAIDSSYRNDAPIVSEIFQGYSSSFEERYDESLRWIFISLGLGLGLWSMILWFAKIDEDAWSDYKLGKRYVIINRYHKY